MNKRDKFVFDHIIRYCNEINDANDQFGNSYDILKINSVYINAVSMCIIQIGELVNHLSDELKIQFNEIPWHDIKRMRNIAAHQYHKLDFNILWETITVDIPNLKNYCEYIINNNYNSEQLS